MQGYVAPTDFDWYTFLSAIPDLQEVNFWQPSGGRGFHSLTVGEPLFFKLKAPYNAVAGFGRFVRHSILPAWLAWDTFGVANGAQSFEVMRRRIEKYRKTAIRDTLGSYDIGCLLLAEPIFFPKDLWIEQPRDWAQSIVQGKGYDLSNGEGRRLWQDCLAAADLLGETQVIAPLQESVVRYGRETVVFPRLGQGLFRVGIIEAYERACAVSGEHSLPALEAAHIIPFAGGGSHNLENGILLRSDFHRLFDKGYITVTPEYHLEVSRRLRDDYRNGKTYYPYHGHPLRLPMRIEDRPKIEHLVWHNENVYLG